MAGERFRNVWRGYDRAEVDTFLARVQAGDVSAQEMIDHAFPLALRGYDSEQVDVYLDGLAQRHHDGDAHLPEP